jgi:hypothetical protein
MAASAPRPAACELRGGDQAGVRATGRLLLRPSEDGWSLITQQGELVFRGHGLDSRQRALELAYERGALVVLS